MMMVMMMMMAVTLTVTTWRRQRVVDDVNSHGYHLNSFDARDGDSSR